MILSHKPSADTEAPGMHHSAWLAFSAAVLLLISFFSSLFYQHQHPEYQAIAGFSLLALVALSVWLGRWPPMKHCAWPLALVTAFWGWWWMSSLWSPVAYASAGSVWTMVTLPATALSALLIASRANIWRLVTPALGLAVAGLAVYACIQFFIFAERPQATFLNQNNFAALQILVVAIAISTSFTARLNRFTHVLLLTLATLLVFVIGLIGSRGALLALLVALALVFTVAVRENTPRSQLWRTGALIAAALVVANLADAGALGREVASLADPHSAGSARFQIWGGSLAMASDSPWYGIGPGLYWLLWPPYRVPEDASAGFYVHNDYLQFLIEAGWPALLLVAATLACVAWLTLRALSRRQGNRTQRLELAGLFAGLAAVAGHSMLTFNLYLMPILLVMGLALARLVQLTNLMKAGESSTRAAMLSLPLRLALSACLIVPGLYYTSALAGSLHFNQAMNAFNEGQPEESATRLQQALDWWEDVDLYHYTLAWVLAQQASRETGTPRERLLNQAHEHLDRAQSLNPYRPHPLVIRGMIFQQHGTGDITSESAEAVAEQQFRAAIERDPYHLHARFRLGRLLLGNNRIEEGMSVLEERSEHRYEPSELSLNYYRLLARMHEILENPERQAQQRESMERIQEKLSEGDEEDLPGLP